MRRVKLAKMKGHRGTDTHQQKKDHFSEYPYDGKPVRPSPVKVLINVVSRCGLRERGWAADLIDKAAVKFVRRGGERMVTFTIPTD